MKPFRLATMLGIRPDLIRMRRLIELLDRGQRRFGYEHIFVHSGQHFDYELEEIFYRELQLRRPDVNFRVGKTLKKLGKTDFVHQLGLLFEKTAEFCDTHKPDAVLFLGDTNTVLASLVVARKNIPVVRIEGGMRSFDWRMPEEKNRIVADHLSDVIYAYLPGYRVHLLREGIAPFRIKVVGNTIVDAIRKFLPKAEKGACVKQLGLKKGEYALCTLHREENIEDRAGFSVKIKDLARFSKKMPVVFPVMPRIARKLKEYKLEGVLKRSEIRATKPLSFLDFLALEKNARVIITDSGTVQEEACILGVPCLVTRRSTERPETIKAGATILAEHNLYENAFKAMSMKKGWSRSILNPQGGSPSERIYRDIVKRIKGGFFTRLRR